MISHKTFNLPLDLNNVDGVFIKSEITKKRLKNIDIIIGSEATIILKKALKTVHNILKEINLSDEHSPIFSNLWY